MKRILVSLLLVVTLLTGIVAMASCGGKKAPVKATYDVPEGGYDGSEVTITFAHTMSATKLQPTLDNYIKKFNELFPNIHIEHSSVGGYDDVVDQISTQLTAGNQPNIAYCYPDHVALYNVARAVVPLDNLINSTIPVKDAKGNETVLGFTEEQLDDFIQGYYAEGAVFDAAGTMYTLPMSKSTEALYYNKTFFENCQKIYASDVMLDLVSGNPVPVYDYEKDDKGEFKLDENGNKIIKLDDNGNPVILAETQPNPYKGNENYNISVPTTWDEMEIVCGKIKAIDPACIPLGYDSEANWFITMTEQLGSGYTTIDEDNYFVFDNETNRNFVKRFREWHQKEYVTTETIYGSYTSGLFTSTEAQKCYMVIGSTGGASYQHPPVVDGKPLFETAMTTPPQVDPANPKVISQGPSLCIFQDENPQEVIASWLFVKFLTTDPSFQAEFSMKSGYAPVIKSVQKNTKYQEWLDKANGFNNLTAMSVKLALDQEKAYYVSPAFNGSSEARKQVGLLMSDIFVNTEADVDAVIDRLFKRAMDECEYAAY